MTAAVKKIDYKSAIAGLTETSKIIRKLYSLVEGDRKVAQVEKLLIELGVRTKDGKQIRYQHVRNTLSQNLNVKL